MKARSTEAVSRCAAEEDEEQERGGGQTGNAESGEGAEAQSTRDAK